MTASILEVVPPRSVVVPWIEVSLPELCSFHRTFGIDCPGCGITRSFIHAAHFRWADSWNANAAGTLIFTCIALSIPWQILMRHTNATIIPRRFLPPWASAFSHAPWIVALTVIMMLQWCLKLTS